MRAVLIGLGGIGSNLVEPLCRTLVFSPSPKAAKRLILLDGDAFEEKNRQRQKYLTLANKAEATREWLAPLFPELEIEAKPYFVDVNNVFLFIRENDAVFLAVDNHATRKLVSDHTSSLKNALLVSGGNELYDGNVQIYERHADQDRTPPLTKWHPEIEWPKDRNPAELDCLELATSGVTQLLAANLTAATLMLNAYTMWLEKSPLPYHEVYFDLKTGNVRPVKLQN